MSSRSKKKCRPSLQIILAALVVAVGGCASAPQRLDVGLVKNSQTLSYVKTIDVIGVGSDDPIKRILAGNEQIRLKSPIAIDLRGDVLLIVDRGDTVAHAGTHAIPTEEQADFREIQAYPDSKRSRKGIAVSSAGIREEDYNRGVIFKYNLKTDRMSIIRGAGDIIDDEISDIYIAKDQSFYVTDVEGRRALHFAPDGKLLKVYRNAPNIFRPIAITVDEERKEVLIADETYSHIVSFDMESGEPKYGMGDRGEGPGRFRIITDMIAIPDGYLVSDRIELRVQVLDKAGNYIADFGRADLMFPTALAMDKFGRVYVSDKSDSTIKVFKAGKLIETIGRNGYKPMEFRYISDMKIHNDQLYVCDNLNGRIQVFKIIPEGNSVALAQ